VQRIGCFFLSPGDLGIVEILLEADIGIE